MVVTLLPLNVFAEEPTPAIATRDASAPEESEVGNDSRDAVHAFVGVQTGGDLNLELSGATGQEFKPIEGVRGYFQWFEDGGYVSPVYTAVSDANGRLNIGAKPYIAADGKLIQFDADPTVSAGHEKYRFWVDETTIPEGYQLQYITGEQVIFPQGAATITQGGSGSDTAKNTHENWKILLMQKPKDSMHREDAKETKVQSDTGGYMTGTVSWDYTSGVGGVQWKFVADHTTPAPDVTVRASYLSDYAMKQIYSKETARLMGVSDPSKIRERGWTSAQEADLQKWVKEQVAKDPTKWIAETVTAKTNAEGNYILQFNGTWGTTRNAEVATDERKVGGRYDGSLHKWTEEEVNRLGTVAKDPNEGTFNRGLVNYWNRKHINYDWMFVSADDSEDLRVMTPYNNNYYTAMNSDWGIHAGWSGVGFGVGVSNAVTSTMKTDFVFGINNIEFGITNYDTGANTALPGDVAETKTTGLPYSKTSERFRIVWYDQDGKVVKEGKTVQPNSTGQIPSEPFDTKNVKKTTEFTAKLYRVDKNGNDQELIAVDSFVVQISNFVLTRYEDFSLANPKPMDNATYEAEGLPDGLTINASNGTVSGRPTRAGFYNVKISTTIQDEGADVKGSRDYRALVTDSPLDHGEVGKEYKQEVKPQAIEGYVFKNVTSKFMDGKEIEGLTIENNQITGTPTKEVPATQTTEDGAMGPNVEVTYDIYKLNSKGEEVLVKTGHKDYVPLEVTKSDSQAPKYVPEYADVNGTPGTEVTTEAPKFLDQKSEADPKPEAETQPTGVKYALGDGAPAGVSVDGTTGKVTYKPSADDAGKTIEVPVLVTYSDKTTDEAVAKINVGDAQNKDYQPEYKEADGTVGQQTTVTAPNFKDGDGQDTTKPADVKFKLGKDAPEGATVDGSTGEVKYTPSLDDAGKTVRIPVLATYKDGSTDEVEAPIKVANADKANYEPNYKPVRAQVGHEVTVASPEFLDNDGNVVAEKPAVTKYELGEGAKDGVTINEQTGEIKYTAVDADKATNIVVPVKATYADGSVDNTTATIVVPSDADFYNPEGKPLETEKGKLPEAKDGVKFTNTPPADTKYEWETKPDVSKAGETFGIVKITYPDGSIDKVRVPVIVKDTTPKTDVTGTPAKVNPTDDVQDTGLTVTNKDETTPTTVTAKDEDGTEVEVTVDPETGKISVKPGTNVDGPITVTVQDDDFKTEDNPKGEKTFEVPVEGHTKGKDDNNNGKPSSGTTDKTDVTGNPSTVEPNGQSQDTGLTVTNKDETTPTTVTAKDEDGTEVEVTVDPETGKISVKPGTNVDGPITVTVQDDDFKTEDNPKGEKTFEVPVEGHTKGKDDNNNGKPSSGTTDKTDVTGNPSTVEPNGQSQDTGLTVTNKDETTPTTVEAVDEDGNKVPVEIGEDGKIKVTPPANVDGPIKVTVEDSDLPGGKVEIEIEVEGHKKGQDDNNNGIPTPGTDPSQPGTDPDHPDYPDYPYYPDYPGYWYDEPSPDYLRDKEYKPSKPEVKAEERELDVFSQYVIGNEDHMFMPNKGITRAEIAQIFARALGYDGYQRNGEYNPYSDLNTNAWYYDAVITTTEAGLFRGTDNGTFEPNREITKAELIATIARFQELGIKDGNTMNMRPDHWALGEVEAAYQEGWLDIYTKGLVNFDADMVITRAEVVAIFNRAFGRIADIAYIDANADRLTTFKDVNKSDWFYYDVITAANTYANYGMEWLHDSDSFDNEFTNLDDIKWDTELRNDKEVIENLRRVKFQRNAR